MGQAEVFEFLKKNKNKWFTSRQIADKLKASYGSVSTSLTKLRQTEQIGFKNNKTNTKIRGRTGVYIYSHKWR